MWLQSTTADERRALLAAYAGYGLDGFDLMIYSFMIPTLLTLWGMTKAEAGHIASELDGGVLKPPTRSHEWLP